MGFNLVSLAGQGLATEEGLQQINTTLGSPAQETTLTTVATNTGPIGAIEASSAAIVANTGSINGSVQDVNVTLGAPAQTVDITSTLVENIGGPGGVGVQHGWTQAATAALVNCAANATTTLKVLTVSRASYMIGMWADWNGTAPTLPFLMVRLLWLDSASGSLVSFEDWFFPAPTAAGAFLPICGKGPCKGDQLTIQVTNFDPARAARVTYVAGFSSIPIDRDDWRNPFLPVGIAGFTAMPQGDPASLYLGIANETNMALGSLTWLMPLYAGQVVFSIESNMTNTGTTTLNVSALMPVAAGFNASGFPLTRLQPGPGITTSQPITLPRTPCLVELVNPTAGNDYEVTVIAQEYAS